MSSLPRFRVFSSLLCAFLALAATGWAQDRFEAPPALVAEKIPVSGLANPALKAVDDAILKLMAEKGLPAVSFSLSKGGKILHDRAFGWADAQLAQSLQPGVKFRLASMTKPVVKAAIQTLAAEGKLKLEEKVFEVLDLGQYPEAAQCDPRFKTVTLQQLLDHKGGWDRDKSGDLTTRATTISKLYAVKLDEMQPFHIIRYGLTLPMDFDPGDRYAYCNYGYIMLARVVEKRGGMPFMAYVQATVAKRAGAASFSTSASDAEDRQPGEIWYCYHPEHPAPEHPLSFRTEARDGAGCLAATTADYCRFLETYWISGMPRDDSQKLAFTFNGSHSGVTAICAQRADGINYAAVANRRGGGKTNWSKDLREAIDTALEAVAARLK